MRGGTNKIRNRINRHRSDENRFKTKPPGERRIQKRANAVGNHIRGRNPRDNQIRDRQILTDDRDSGGQRREAEGDGDVGQTKIDENNFTMVNSTFHSIYFPAGTF